MNEREAAFVRFFVIDRNATQAAAKAGYSRRTAYSQGSRLLKKPEVQDAIQQLREKAERESIATMEEVLQRMTAILRSESRPADRIQAGKVLLQSVPAHETATAPPTGQDAGETPTEGANTRICLPVMFGEEQSATGAEMPDGTILPFAGHEQDESIFYLPYNRDNSPYTEEDQQG